MDDTLFDYVGSLKKELDKLRSPNEKKVSLNFKSNPEYIRNRINLITKSEDFWVNMPKFKLGWDILGIAQELSYRIMILTKGPKRKPIAWSGKKKCIDKHFGEDFGITQTTDKGLVYGKVLVDDFPDYIDSWLKWRKNGQVIMPAHKHNEHYEHPQVIRYDRTNLREVWNAMEKIKNKTINS